MALVPHILIEIGDPSTSGVGVTPIVAKVESMELTWNPEPGNLHMDADLVTATIETMAAELVEKINQRIHDWATVQTRLGIEHQEKQERLRRQMLGDDDE